MKLSAFLAIALGAASLATAAPCAGHAHSADAGAHAQPAELAGYPSHGASEPNTRHPNSASVTPSQERAVFEKRAGRHEHGHRHDRPHYPSSSSRPKDVLYKAESHTPPPDGVAPMGMVTPNFSGSVIDLRRRDSEAAALPGRGEAVFLAKRHHHHSAAAGWRKFTHGLGTAVRDVEKGESLIPMPGIKVKLRRRDSGAEPLPGRAEAASLAKRHHHHSAAAGWRKFTHGLGTAVDDVSKVESLIPGVKVKL